MAEANRTFADHTIQIIFQENVESLLSPKCCIYKVPPDLKKENEGVYTPYLVSIGPIHHNNEKFKLMEKEKVKYFDHFYRRLDYERKQHLEDYTAHIVNEELKIRRHYSETYPELDKEKFVRMILLDTIFIMEIFLRELDAQSSNETKDDYLFTKTWIKKGIERDLLLMENQIPFYLLETLCDLIPVERDGRRLTFLELSYNYFKRYDPYPEVPINDDDRNTLLKSGWKSPKHFTDLLRYFFIPHHLSRDDDAPPIKTATKLKNAGITFEPISNGCLLDVKFEKIPVVHWLSCLLCCLKCVKARLQIPKLTVDDSTEYILRNLMAFEQSHYPSHHYVCNYVALLDYLIDTEEDVDVMVESKVIVHELGCDKDLASLFNTLSKNIVTNYHCYGSLSRKLDRHYHNPINRIFLTPLRSIYFKDIWRGTGTLAGIIVLAFAIATFIKTVKDFHVKH